MHEDVNGRQIELEPMDRTGTRSRIDEIAMEKTETTPKNRRQREEQSVDGTKCGCG